MKKTFLIICIFLFAHSLLEAKGRFALGPQSGLIVQNQTDPSGNASAYSIGLPLAVSGVYQFGHVLSPWALDYSVGYGAIDTFVIRHSTVGGITGTYREKTHLFFWDVGGRYYFLKNQWRPWAGADVGVRYFKRSNVEFRDSFNTALPTPNVTNHFNLSIAPHVGIEYRPTFRWAIGLGLKSSLSFRSSGILPAFEIPLTIQVAF